MLLAFKLKQSDLAEQIQTAGELDDASYKRMVKINNDFQKALMTPVTIASFEPTYDSESNVTGEGINLNSVTQTRSYTYDAENQLLTADTPNVDYTYTYDQRNNRLTQRIVSTSPALDVTDYYSYNKEDELLTWERRNTQSQVVLEAYTFVYDNVGDCISQTKTSVTPNEVTEYEYYVGGNLKQVTLPDASEISYLYDANSNRIRKTNATEIIEYHYAGSELKSEVHKNKQNNTVLYTLTYYPYGFSKTVGQTTTSYYYIVDNRGFVWALTDSAGVIVETYDYSPYGELLSTPSITNHLFLSGADQCIYDEETSMVHLNNRYYIPKLGRFLQRDSVEGTPDSTISQNLYTYCQNSPITLVDPSGNSPQNTGTPARTEFVNPSAYAGGLNCNMPDMNKVYGVTLCDSDPIAIDFDAMTAKPIDSPSGEFSSCSDTNIMGGGIVPDSIVATTTDENGNTVYTVKINGKNIDVTVDKNGNVKGSKPAKGFENDPDAKDIAKAINDACYDIQSKGGKIGDARNFLNRIAYNTEKHYGEWKELANTPEGKREGVSGNIYDFIFHTTRGIVISNGMSKIGKSSSGYNYDQYDDMFGFNTSFQDKKRGMKLSFGERKKGDLNPGDSPTIYDYADYLKAEAWQETRIGADVDTWTIQPGGIVGIMQSTGPGSQKKDHPFFSIFWGSNEFSELVAESTRKPNKPPTFGHNTKCKTTPIMSDLHWASGGYFGWLNDGQDPPYWYMNQVWQHFKRLRKGKPMGDFDEYEDPGYP